ncbi:hypothetical protein [Thalassoporum mexicanum]|uniref:hypothetical protein n=1 Tax=Thalassoporum mexicanum TaxID=3457544 RepID=UPI0030D96E63
MSKLGARFLSRSLHSLVGQRYASPMELAAQEKARADRLAAQLDKLKELGIDPGNLPDSL